MAKGCLRGFVEAYGIEGGVGLEEVELPQLRISASALRVFVFVLTFPLMSDGG